MKKFFTIVLLFFITHAVAFRQPLGKNQMEFSSLAFQTNTLIPKQYTCDDKDMSPPLQWKNAPLDTKSFALIVDDPDAPHGTWDHWILFNIPARVHELKENISELPSGTQEGKNSWGKTGYGGPCPPTGTHRYFFKLYALNTTLALKTGATKARLLEVMQNHIIAQCEFIGKYQRQK